MALSVSSRPHGGDVFAAASELGCRPGEILDFSASINPLGPPASAMAAARNSLTDCIHYPEIAADSLRQALAGHHGLDPAHLLPGSGSTELLYLLPRVLRPRRALLVVPAFSEYARALDLLGCPFDIFPLLPNRPLQPDRLCEAIDDQTDLVILANPGNPVGNLLPRELLLDLAERLRDRVDLVIDEAFIDFSPADSLLSKVPAFRRLWVLRSLTKFYAIPGLRVGFLAGSVKGIERVAAAREPWRIATPAIAAALACLQDADYHQQTLELIPVWREQLMAGLQALGLTPCPGAANFLLLRLPKTKGTSTALTAALRQQGILIRDCGNFDGLDGQWLRLAVRRPEENARLLDQLALTLQGAKS